MPFETVRVRVAPGDRLVMCTDGLVEVRGEDIGVGLATLCESAAHPAASMDDACDTIIRALAETFSKAGRGGRKDDVALLMARLNGIEPEDVAEWRLAREPDRGGPGPAPWSANSSTTGGSTRCADNAELMVSELVTNAVRHAREPAGSSCGLFAATRCCARWTTTTHACRRCSVRGAVRRVRARAARGQQAGSRVGHQPHGVRQDRLVRA